MCATCGCDTHHAHDHDHDHAHAHDHAHDHEHHHHHHDKIVRLEHQLLAENDRVASEVRSFARERGLRLLNLMSSPGAGKTTLLERTITELGPETSSVIEGDQATARDAERIRKAGARAVQVNTGTGCHLDARMVQRALRELDPARGSTVFIENVGNLVCPALFDLGQESNVVVVSVTEGDDKPLKYPHMFAAADLLVLNKIDLLPYVSFDGVACLENARRIKRSLRSIELSATTGEGVGTWKDFLATKGDGA
jgi:hydrogenase nickel incorporation protein HypB